MHLYNIYVTFLEAVFASLIFRVVYTYFDPFFSGGRKRDWPHHDDECCLAGCTIDHRKVYNFWVNIVQFFAFVISFLCIGFYKSM